jgi:hypothetical protein
MHKVVWFGGALSVAAAGALALATEYSARHPNTALGGCLVAGYRLSTECNPLYQLGRKVAEQAHLAAQDGAVEAACAEILPANECLQAGDQAAGVQLCPQSTEHRSVQEYDRDLVESRLDGKIVIEEEVERATLRGSELEEESEEPARVMPPAEVNMRFAPRIMPYAGGALEKAEPRGTGGLPDCREDPNSGLQFPGCPFLEGRPSPISGGSSFAPEETQSNSVVPEPRKKAGPYPIHLQGDPRMDDSPYPTARIDTLDLRPGDMKPYKGQPVPF